MPFLPASRTKRNLFKIASLGLAGLLAGLLSGCTDSPNTSVNVSYAHATSDSLNPDTAVDPLPTDLPKSLDETQIPALRHPPTAHRVDLASVHTVAATLPSNGRIGY
jgi:hypothetical protein